ncbi:MAG: YwiC-like family protein, partial [Cyanobacteria bacterium J06632_3]
MTTSRTTSNSSSQLSESASNPPNLPASGLTQTSKHKKKIQRKWYSPTVSPEHGAYVVLIVSFLTGAAAAQQWTWATTLALLCAFCGFQAEHPLVLQIKQRRSWKPRFL